jgi:hypothetical protein
MMDPVVEMLFLCLTVIPEDVRRRMQKTRRKPQPSAPFLPWLSRMNITIGTSAMKMASSTMAKFQMLVEVIVVGYDCVPLID